jgi:hypothetical protein
MPAQAGIYYFEVTLLSKRRDEYAGSRKSQFDYSFLPSLYRTTVCVGFLGKSVTLARPPGWEPESWGYHGDDGDIYSGGNVGKKYDETFSAGDVVGCGVNFRTGQAFFTRNAKKLGPSCNPPLFPKSPGAIANPCNQILRFVTSRASYILPWVSRKLASTSE